MKRKNVILSFLILFLINLTFSQSKLKKTSIDSLIFYKEFTNKICSDCIRADLDSAIYFLIDNINLKQKSIIGYQDIHSSSLAPNPNFVGMNAIYFLEIILRDSLKNKNITEIKLFRKCVLISKKNRYVPLTMKDMNYLKSIYLKWYNETAKLSLQKKREIWESKFRSEVTKFYEWI